MDESVVEDVGALDSWEVADLDATVRRLMISSKKEEPKQELSDAPSSVSAAQLDPSASASASFTSSENGVPEDVVSQVDQFLREALQNPRERLSVLRMEQDVEKFIRDPSQQQLEFQQLPTSYLRLAAHRVAQHYSLQSMVLLENSAPDGSGSKIIVRKTSDMKHPPIRLADIPVNLPSEDGGAVKVAIKQRPQKHSQIASNLSTNSSKANSNKSVEERKEEYNRARARIFSSSSGSNSAGKPNDPWLQESSYLGSPGMLKMEEKTFSGVSDVNFGRGLIDSSASSSRTARGRVDNEPVCRQKPNNRVAIFRDRETERKDPDYDRNYDRYMQRFDPGFGFTSGPYTMQPMYAPAINYNTEFPQLGSNHRSQLPTEHQPRPLPQHMARPWPAPSTPTGMGYGHPESMIPHFNHNAANVRSTSAIYMHSSQYPCQHPGMHFIHPHGAVQHFPQSQHQPDASFGLARPR